MSTGPRYILARLIDDDTLELYLPQPVCGGITTHPSVGEAEAARGDGDPDIWPVWELRAVGGEP